MWYLSAVLSRYVQSFSWLGQMVKTYDSHIVDRVEMEGRVEEKAVADI